MKAETTFSLKDQLFNPESVGRLASLFADAMPTFPGDAFQAAVLARNVAGPAILDFGAVVRAAIAATGHTELVADGRAIAVGPL